MNKNKTKIKIERWETPVAHAQDLWLQGLLQTVNRVHLFFSIDLEKNIHVMTFVRGSPYRVVEEGYGDAYTDKYFTESNWPEIKDKGNGEKYQKTWKVWGTPFIDELDEGYELSHFEKVNGKFIHDETIFEYFFVTQDEWIEIVMPYKEEVKWDYFPNAHIKDVVALYLSKGDWD